MDLQNVQGSSGGVYARKLQPFCFAISLTYNFIQISSFSMLCKYVHLCTLNSKLVISGGKIQQPLSFVHVSHVFSFSQNKILIISSLNTKKLGFYSDEFWYFLFRKILQEFKQEKLSLRLTLFFRISCQVPQTRHI